MPEIAPPVAIAAFDFDGTLTRGDSLRFFLLRGLGWPGFLRVLLRCSPWLLGYALRLVRNDVAKARLLRAALSGRSVTEMADWTTRWLAQDLPGELREWTLARLAWHQQAGHCCVLVSASPDIYLRRAALKLGFDALLCTEMQVQGDVMTGNMRTPNCHGEQKVVRLKQWLNERFGSESLPGVVLYAYGDTAGDKPMLRWAQHAWYRSQPWTEAASATDHSARE